jgi:hypothetical protein
MMNSLGTVSNSFVEGTTTLANSAFKAVNAGANAVVNAVVDTTTTVANSTTAAVNSGLGAFSGAMNSTSSAMKNIPVINSLVSNGNAGTNVKPRNNTTTSGNASANTFTNVSANSGSSWAYPVGIFLFLTIFFLAALVLFKSQIKTGVDNIISTVRKFFGAPATNVVPPEPPVSQEEVPKPGDVATENITAGNSILNKLLPMTQKEVFNINANDYSFYDAEPLCRALGAELASYSQVKDAWEKGADWCNYGWVKGQAAVYPTQKETWDKLQNGPEDEKYACGNPGVNGGYFDNPEMRFGVSCYGVKPDQSSNDVKNLMAYGSTPKTPATLKVDRQIQEYKESIGTIGVLPFSDDKWSA